MKKYISEHWLEIFSLAVGSMGAIIGIVFVFRLIANDYSFSGTLNLEDSARTGDFVGGVIGSFWALTSVLLLFLTLRLQRKGIVETSEALRIQQFENNFYNLVKTQQEIVNSIEVEIRSYDENGAITTYKSNGRKFFTEARRDLKSIYEFLTSDKYSTKTKSLNLPLIVHLRYNITENDYNRVKEYKNDKLSVIKESYQFFFNKHNSEIGHYFRHLYHIIKYVKEAEGSDKRTHEIKHTFYCKYANFIQAQMSSAELFLLFYNCICFRKMKESVEYYDLLENLPFEDLIEEDHRAFYVKGLKSRKEIFTLDVDLTPLQTDKSLG
ncbi:MAG: putative phage abortive infection protein [Bacteroidia bacterium]|nr:putative phage abortive infection protein [Bacteroidia bacterium]